MSRLKSFKKFHNVDKEKSNKGIWIVLSCFIFVITLIVFSTYAKYVFINENVEVSSGAVSDFYYEELLNGSYPLVSDDLVPIIIDNNGTVYKADLGNEWYKYEDKRWANAIVLKDTSRIIGEENIIGAVVNNNSVTFDGVDDYVNLGLAKYEFNTNISISVNFKFNSFNPSAVNGIIGNWDGSGGGIYYNNGELIGTVYVEELESYVNVSTSFSDLDNYHLTTMTYDGNTLKLFLDGELVDSESAIGTFRTSRMPFLLGANPNQNGENTFYLIELSNVNIREYAIYNTTLSDEEIITNMNDRIGISSTNGLLGYGNYTGSFVDNSIIPESHIESYFVWIPKYSYRLWDLGEYNSVTGFDSSKVHAIGIRFGTTNTSDGVLGECSTPGIAGSSGNCSVGDYMTHPAFLSFDTNGLWVGKFETGYDGATTKDEAKVNESDIEKVIIKPNVYSWRSATVGNMFKTSYEYDRNNDSHMMKNTEWGAVAYLSHSDYGINDEVRIHNNSSYVTGSSATVAPTIGYNKGVSVEGNRVDSTAINTDGTYTVNYLNNSSVKSSTTGNYTGIYDMSGGAWEYVMGYTTGASLIGGDSEITTYYEDFYTNSNFEKYYDKYSSTSDINYNNRILGDGTGEMGPFLGELDPDNITRVKSSWYGDYGCFATSSYPWFYRGGPWDNGSSDGVFAFSYHTGGAYGALSYRIVLSPKN